MAAKHLKGTYNLNPTSQVMKQGSKQERAELSRPGATRVGGPRMSEAHTVPADNEGVESQIHNSAHPAMQTRHSHPRNEQHADGRGHEDHHHAVRKLKGM
jgi:hypothetical protein